MDLTHTNLEKLHTEVPQPFDVHETPAGNSKVVIKAMTKFFSEEEIKQVKQGFRRSHMNLESLMDDIYSMDIPYFTPILDENFEKALRYVDSKMFPGKQKFRPVALQDMKHYPWTRNVSACEPFYSDPDIKELLKEKQRLGINSDSRCTFGNLFDEIFDQTATIQNRIGIDGEHLFEKFTYDILAFARSHIVEGDDPDKIRFVYGCPKPTVITEAQFLWPIFAEMKRHPSRHLLAWGYETLKGGMAKIQKEIAFPGKHVVVAADWKSFDKRVHYEVINRVYAKITEHIDFDHGYAPTHDRPTYTAKECTDLSKILHNLWNWTIFANKYAPIRAPTGDRFKRRFAGIPSGLFATNYLDSWVNAVCIVTILLSIGIKLDDIKFMKVMGDDSLLTINISKWNFEYRQLREALSYQARRIFNFILSDKKSTFTDTFEGVTFLGFTCRSSMPVKSSMSLLASLAHPEKSSSWEILAARCIGIAYASCMSDRRVYDTCKDIYEFITMKMMKKPLLRHIRSGLEYIGVPDNIVDFPTEYQIIEHLFDIKHDTSDANNPYFQLNIFLDYE